MKKQPVKLTNKSVGFDTKINWKVRMDNNTLDLKIMNITFLCYKWPGFAAVWAEASKIRGTDDTSCSTVTTTLLQMVRNMGIGNSIRINFGDATVKVRARLTAIIESSHYKYVSPKMVRDIMMQELEAEINKGETSND